MRILFHHGEFLHRSNVVISFFHFLIHSATAGLLRFREMNKGHGLCLRSLRSGRHRHKSILVEIVVDRRGIGGRWVEGKLGIKS